MSKLVKCVVKAPKGLWHEKVCHPKGTELELQETTVVSMRKRGALYAEGEYEALLASNEAKAKAAAEEKEARKPVEAPKATKASTKKTATKGVGSKGS